MLFCVALGEGVPRQGSDLYRLHVRLSSSSILKADAGTAASSARLRAPTTLEKRGALVHELVVSVAASGSELYAPGPRPEPGEGLLRPVRELNV
jgi:hypothetical protein